MRRRLAAAAVAAALPCAGLLAAPTAAQADGCGTFAWAQVGYDYPDGTPVPDGVPMNDATQSEALPVNGSGCADFTTPLDVRLETTQAVPFTAIITLDSSLAGLGCTADVSGTPVPLVDIPATDGSANPHGEVPFDVSDFAVGTVDLPVTVTCGDLTLAPVLRMNVIGSPDNTDLSLTKVVAKVRTLVTGRLVSRRTHRGIAHAVVRLRRHGLRVGTAYTDRRGYWVWHNQGAPTDHVWARYRSTVRHLGTTSHR